MKHFLWLVLCGSLIGMAQTALPLVNGDFEQGLKGWNADDRGMTLFVREAACHGSMGVRLTDDSPKTGADLYSERLKAKENTVYGISCMGRSADTLANASVYLMCYDARGRCLTEHRRTGELMHIFKNTAEWQRHLFLARTPKGTATVAVRFHSGMQGKGGMDIDDVEIHEYTEQEAKKTGHPVAVLSKTNREDKMLNVAPEEILKALAPVEVSTHPRLFASAPQFAALKQAVENGDGVHAKFYGRLAYLADTLLDVPPLVRKLDGRRMLGQSRIEVYRISTLALCYRLGGKEAWRDRCLEEMRAVARFQDWNPSHFLDVGEMTLAMATGYDWLYDEISDEDRALFARAIIDKGLKSSGPTAWWRQAENNWGQVCNTGMIAGALAVADVDPESCRRQLVESVRNLAIPMRAYAPNGNYPEGPGYWEYGTGFNVLGLAMLHQAFGTDFGLSELAGFKETGAYFDYLVGPTGKSFPYADCGGGGRSSLGTVWWFARFFNQPELIERNERAQFERICADRKPVGRPERDNGWFRAYSFFWLADREGDGEPLPELPLVWNAGGQVPIVVMRNTWEREKMVFLGLKGGTPSANHAHMDGGSFVLDARCIRWLDDLGAEGYGRIEAMGIGLWNMRQDSERWKLFRLNNFGHNTLVIDNQLQQVKGTVAILRAEKTAEGNCVTVMDMTGVYSNVCRKAIRTVTLAADGTVDMVDELEGLKPEVPVVWGGLTRQKAALRGGNGVRLTSGDVHLDVISGGAGEWSLVDVTHPQPEFRGNSENKGVTRLVLSAKAPADGRLSFKVTMKISDGE